MTSASRLGEDRPDPGKPLNVGMRSNLRNKKWKNEMITKDKEIKVRNEPDNQELRIPRTPEKAKEWSNGAEQAEHLLIKIKSELSISRVAGDFQPAVVHHLRNIQSQMDRIKQEIRWIETRLKETLVIEREWWKK